MIHGLKISEGLYRTQQIKYSSNLTLQIQDEYNVHSRQEGQDLHRLREINQTVLPKICKGFEKSIKEALCPAGGNPSDKVIAATSTYIS